MWTIKLARFVTKQKKCLLTKLTLRVEHSMQDLSLWFVCTKSNSAIKLACLKKKQKESCS